MADSTLTIIHFNDVYNIEPQTIEPVGGAARMAGYIQSCQNIGLNPLVLFSGDALNPSIMSIFLKGEQMIPILNLLGVRCAVLGNHDFDFGVDHLEDVMAQTNFPWLMSNVYDNLTCLPLARCENKYMIEWNGIKIGLLGLVEEEWIATLATLDPEDVTFRDFVDEGRRLAKELKEDGADLVIALTHMRWPNDRRLAESVEEVDIILAGHDHDYNVEMVNGKYIIKSGTDFRNLSKISITLNHSGMSIIDVQRVDLDSSIEEDPDVKESVNHIRGDIDLKMDEELGTMAVEMDGRFRYIRTQETNLGNFVTDIILEACPADCCILNSGTFRSDRIHPKGLFRLRDLLTILPLVDPLCVIRVSGEGILKALENGVSQYPSLEGRFPQVAGIEFGFDPSKPRGQRVEKDLVKIQDDYLQLNREYRLCTKEYIASGKDGYDVFKDCEILVTSEQCPTISTAVRNHFESVQMCQGVKPCRSGHRQSLVSLVRRESLVRQASVDHLNLSHALVRQMSVHNVEEEQCYLAPTVEGRIFLLDDEKRQSRLKSKIPSSHNIIDEIIRENSKEHESMDSTEDIQLMEAATSGST